MGSPGFLTSPMFNIAFVLVTMQYAKKIDWEDPEVLNYARIGYYSAQVLVILLSYGLIALINKKNDTTELRYTNQPKPSFTSPQAGEPQEIKTTNRDYDVSQVKQLIQSSLTSVAMISVMHWKFNFTQPLLLQSILPFKNLLAHKVALIHIWGDAAEGALKRPFTAENPLAALFGGMNGATEPAATTETTSSSSTSDHDKKE